MAKAFLGTSPTWGCVSVGEAEVTVLNAPPPKPCSICGADYQSNVEFLRRGSRIGYACHECVYQMFAEAVAAKEAQEEQARA